MVCEVTEFTASIAHPIGLHLSRIMSTHKNLEVLTAELKSTPELG